jgi:hypothetical protein
VTVMGAYRRALSQASLDARSPRLAPLHSPPTRVSASGPAYSNFSVLVYRRHAKTRCGWRYGKRIFLEGLLRTSRKRCNRADGSKNGVPARAPVPEAEWRFRVEVTFGRFSDAMPAGENTCGVDSFRRRRSESLYWARAVAEDLLLMGNRCCHRLGCLGATAIAE